MKKLYTLALASVALLAACSDDDDPTGSGGGSGYTATITGLPGITQSSGTAFWTEGTEQGVTSFVIGLQPTNAAQVGFLIFRSGAGRAETGQYTFVDNNVDAPTPQQFQLFANLSPYICGALTGTHTITESGSSRVKGALPQDEENLPAVPGPLPAYRMRFIDRRLYKSLAQGARAL